MLWIAAGGWARGQAGLECLDILSQKYANFPEISLVFDVWVTENGQRTHNLTIEEARGKSQTYCRAIHWYDRRFYEFREARFDQTLNSYYWSPQGKARYFENLRYVHLEPGNTFFTREPSIERYLGFLGLLCREREFAPEFIELQKSHSEELFEAHDFYLPWALSDRKRWVRNPRNDGLIEIENRCPAFVDTIIFDPAINSIQCRKVKDFVRSKTLELVYKRPYEILPGCFIPYEIEIDIGENYKMAYVVKEFKVGLADNARKPVLKTGTVLRNEKNDVIGIVRGESEILNETVTRMRMALAQVGSRKYIDPPTIWFVCAAVGFVCVFVLHGVMVK